ncbi:MAG: DUF488 domain-containing protein, partial [Parabacteroides sp.]|nr:DUF488 domain-containing protein [Parabacteroides sp.]
FTQKTAEEFFEKLKAKRIDCLIDIRLNPNGQLSRFAFEKDLPYFLEKLVDGCKYVHRIDLAPKKELLKEVRDKDNPMSRNYKLFEIAFNKQLENYSNIRNFVNQFGKYERVVLLCSEPTIEKCHRRLVSDMLLKLFNEDIKFGGNL